MKALIERQLYRPAVVLPLLVLMRLMVTLDFNLMQVTFVVVMKGSQYMFQAVFRHRHDRGDAQPLQVHAMHDETCHC
ncbi:hypothetical protein EOS_11350 [Caballeronia mineralivorans PML1(12)]|uniref:Uncharacterized protein n=1 Tax=Caballeronia mineralivorans PML1(12) TaxID=908627 RepID=A0A0J1D0C3_9BURK|nr:hypothetical protein [Caballeronia mineralivorans]KLU26091.1 hypothetical protein EOS_11350 [Caballeronia mineralivorans PML1(12)]